MPETQKEPHAVTGNTYQPIIPGAVYLIDGEALVADSHADLRTTEGSRVGYVPEWLILMYAPGDDVEQHVQQHDETSGEDAWVITEIRRDLYG